MTIFISPKSPFPYLSFNIWYLLNTHYPPINPRLYIYNQNIAPSCLLIYCQPSGHFCNEKFSFPLFLLSSDCSVWTDHIAQIQYFFSDTTKSNIIFSLLFYRLTLIFSDYLYSSYSNPIQSIHSLLPAMLSPLCPLELLILLKINHH